MNERESSSHESKSIDSLEISRRQMLKFTLTGGAILAAGLVGFDNRNELLQWMFRTREMDFSGSNGKKFRGLFLMHGNRGVDATPLYADQLRGYRTTILETGATDYLRDESMPEKILHGLMEFYLPNLDFDTGSRIVFNDIAISSLEPFIHMAKNWAIFGVSSMALEKKEITRRAFLKKIFQGGVFISVLRSVKSYFHLIDSVLPNEAAKILTRIASFADLSEPEAIYASFREAVIAAKILDLNCHANIIFGKKHATLMSYLQSQKSAIYRYLKMFPPKYVSIAIKDQRYLWTSAVLEKKEHGDNSYRYETKLVVHDKLKEIFDRD